MNANIRLSAALDRIHSFDSNHVITTVDLVDYYSLLDNALYCLTIPLNDESQSSAAERKAALIAGYLTALHQTHTYRPSLFTHGNLSIKQNPLVEQVRTELAQFDDPYANAAKSLLSVDNNLPSASGMLPITFCSGYQLGFHTTQTYNRCLYLTRHELIAAITADVIMMREKCVNASRAESRIIINYYNKGRTQPLRDLVFDHAPLDDQDNPFEV